jgi:hypothetical protein
MALKVKERRSKILLTLSLGLLLLSLVLGGLYLKRVDLAYPLIAHFAQKFNLPVPALRIEEIGLTETTLHDVKLGEELSLKKVYVRYSLFDLINQQIGEIVVDDLFIDASHYEEGVLGTLQEMFTSGDTSQTATTTSAPLPEITINNARIVYNTDQLSAHSTLTLHIPAVGKPTFRAEVDIESPFARLDQLTLTGEASPTFDKVDFQITDGRIEDQSKSYLIPALHLTAEGTLTPQNVEATFNLKDKAEKLNIMMETTADFAQAVASLAIQVPLLTFTPSGLQPADLSPFAQLPSPLDASVSSVANILINAENIVAFGDLNITSQNLPLDIPALQTLSTKGKASFQYDHKDQRLTVTSNDLRLSDKHAKKRFEDLTFKLVTRLEQNEIHNTTQIALQSKPNAPLLLIEGTYNPSVDVGQASVNTPVINWGTEFKGKDLSPLLKDLTRLTGQTRASSTLNWRKGKLDSNLHLTFDNFTIANDLFTMENLDTDLFFPSLFPPKTAKSQKIEIDAVKSVVDLLNPRLKFSLSPKEAQLQEVTAGFLGGTLSIKDARFPFGADRQTAVLMMKQLALAEFFKLSGVDGLTGTGRLSGEIPFTFVNDDVEIDNAILASEESGVLRFNSQAAKDMLGSAGEQMALVLDVLANFHYKSLSLKINRKLGQNAVLTMGLEGHNPDVKDGYPFKLNINLETNLDKILATVREGYRLSSQAIRFTIGLDK